MIEVSYRLMNQAYNIACVIFVLLQLYDELHFCVLKFNASCFFKNNCHCIHVKYEYSLHHALLPGNIMHSLCNEQLT